MTQRRDSWRSFWQYFGVCRSGSPQHDLGRSCPGFRNPVFEQLETRRLLSGASLLSATTALTSGGGSSTNPAVSGDGRFVAFQSFAEDLVSIDANTSEDIFVRDRDADEDGVFDEVGEPGAVTTTLISVNSGGSASGTGPSLFKGASVNPSISDDGRYMVFVSYATDLVAGVDIDETPNVFLRDRDTDGDGVFDEPGGAETFLVSVDRGEGGVFPVSGAGMSGGPVASPFVGPTGPERPVISADGGFIAFVSGAADVILDDDMVEDFNGATLDVFKVATADAGTPVSLVSMNYLGTGSGATILAASSNPTISASGGLVAFQSRQTDLVNPEKLPNPFMDVFVGAGGAPPELVSINAARTGGGDGPSFEPVISRDGRQVAFFSKATDLVKRDENGTTDVFVRDLVAGRTTLVSMSRTDPATGSGNGASPISSLESKRLGGPSVSGNGRFIAYASAATDLLDLAGGVTDDNGRPDVYVFDRDPDGNRVFDEPGKTETRLVSVNMDGASSGTHLASGVRGSFAPVISADGRYVAFVSSAVDLVPGGTDGTENVYLRDLVEGTTTLISASITPELDDTGGSGASGIVGLVTWPLAIPASAPRVAFSSSATDLDADTTDAGPLPDIYAFAPAGDIRTFLVRAGGMVSGIAALRSFFEPVGVFEVGVYRSDDAMFDAGDELLATTSFENDPSIAESIAGSLLGFTIGAGGTPDEFPFPGTADDGADETDSDYYILVVADPLDAIDEFDVDPLNEDNTGFLSGVYHLPGGSVFIHGRDLPTTGESAEKITTTTTTDGTEMIVAFAGSIRGTLTYDLADVTGLRVRSHSGDDSVVGSDMADFIHGGPGDDRIDGGPGDDTLDGGPGADTILGGPGFDTIIDTDGDDTIDLGPDGGIVFSDPGSDDIFIGSDDHDTVDFSLSDQGITIDLDSEAIQTVDEDLNTIQLIGNWEDFIGSSLDDSLFVRTVPFDRTLIGGLGNDRLLVDARGNPVISDGTKFEIPGLGTIFYSGFESIQVVNTPPQIIDDGDAGYSAPGFTRIADPQFPQGFGDDVEYSAAGSGNTATWTFSNIAPGAYYVSATWTSAPDRATNAPYTIRDGGAGGTIIAELRVDQEQPPAEFEDQGEFWRNLAVVAVTANTLTVELSDSDADQFVLADAIRIEPLNTSLNHEGNLLIPILDDAPNGQESFSSNGTPAAGGGFLGDFHTLGAQGETATWSFSDLPPGPYFVSATWTPGQDLSDSAGYTIDVGGSRTEVAVNQQIAPGSFSEGGTLWERLAKIDVTNGATPVIELSDPLGNPVIADAIRIDPAPNIELFARGLPIQNGGTVDFGTTAIDPNTGLATIRVNVEIINTGIAPLILSNLDVSGLGFSLGGLGQDLLPPGGKTELELLFESDVLGDSDGDVSFDSNDLDAFPFTINLHAEIVVDDTPPTVEIISPTDGSSLIEGSTIGIEVDADDDIGVSRVDLLVDGETVQTDTVWPFVFDFTLPALNGPTVEVGARVADIAGNTTDAPPVTIHLLDDQPPTVQIVAPQNGESVIEGQSISVVVDATDDINVTRVDFLIDGAFVDSSTFAPFGGQITVPVGVSTFALEAWAIDTAGNATVSTVNLAVLRDLKLPLVLGVVDFVTLPGQEPVGGELWYQIVAASDGILTVEGLVEDNADILLELREGSQESPVLIASSQVAHGQRFDWQVTQGTEYYVRFAGNTSADLRVANLLQKTEASAIVHGTSDDDDFGFNPSGPANVSINGVEYVLSNEEMASVVFTGGAGTDTVVVDDTSRDELLFARPGYLSFADTGGVFELVASDFELLLAYARNGGHDQADLEGSAGYDKFKSDFKAEYAKVYGGALYHRVKFFEKIAVHSQGGDDLARLFGSEDDDSFEGQMDRSVFSSDTVEIHVHQFPQVVAYARKGGFDVATFLPSHLKDEFHGRPHKAQLFDQVTDGDVYHITAWRFDEYHSSATPGGRDKAKLWDTVHDDLLNADSQGAAMSRDIGQLDLLYEVLAFDMVKANGFGGGTNRREISDPLGWELVFDGDWES